MISIEAYRSAIGRFYGKARKIDKPKTFQPSELIWFLFWMFLVLLVLCAFSFTELFIHLIMVVVLIMAYGYCLTIFCITMDLVAHSFQNSVHRQRVFRKPKPSLPGGIKPLSALIPCCYLDTFVLDGRDGNPGTESKLLNIESYIGVAYRLLVKYLGTSVLDGRVKETRLNKLKTRKLFTTLTKCIRDILCDLIMSHAGD